MVCFRNGLSNVKGKSCSRWPSTNIIPQKEECLDQYICANQRITTRELCMELQCTGNDGSNAEILLSLCHMGPTNDQIGTERTSFAPIEETQGWGSFLDCIITCDEM